MQGPARAPKRMCSGFLLWGEIFGSHGGSGGVAVEAPYNLDRRRVEALKQPQSGSAGRRRVVGGKGILARLRRSAQRMDSSTVLPSSSSGVCYRE
jgi:hypothetical protein